MKTPKHMHIRTEHAVSMGITAAMMFLSGAAYGAGLFTQGETLFAMLVSAILGFVPIVTLTRPPHPRDLGQRQALPPPSAENTP